MPEKLEGTPLATQPSTSPLLVERLPLQLNADPTRVLLRPYDSSGPEQARNIISRALAVPEAELPGVVESILREFGERHHVIRERLLARFQQIRSMMPTDQDLSDSRQLLLGACFSAEYSLECAALFNPSIVAHPDQSGVSKGSLRFVMSLRATGEGHISSITFRSGVIDKKGQVRLDKASRLVIEPEPLPTSAYERGLFSRKLYELGLSNGFVRRVVESLEEEFTLQELRQTIHRERWKRRNLTSDPNDDPSMDDKILSLALSNYVAQFSPHQDLSERAIFPVTPSQRNGIEDARFVRFEDGTYYGTYTAYDGRLILPQLIETDDFLVFRFLTLNGPAVKNKGMALFPRKIDGLYTMLSRQDGENLHLMQSDNIHFWNESKIILRPRFAWEMVQVGNCGSPIETPEGWLVLTHGVGPMRQYSIGVILLDLKDPSKVIGRLKQPLLRPTEEEREGYVPNVTYTCGALVHAGQLIVPYAISDSAIRFARVELQALLSAMV